ncbi:uncharacterized protein RHOBADRAFT_50713 [Rhodotorula graminis WP1]|uniref:protein-tyrosine-phosphatase n=1 Tax=Rhodotorula graminis (strain WP1) TaxID=578459 RepID=A0A194SC93_RHOGW|nr:uncharacterized protein RHOBADRAFT_50713 [Rhodotorula graminis WP1]KPV78219.1 hypothetical protein RHOBADRAFT_50713 [Rhodotorula graminis WP1]
MQLDPHPAGSSTVVRDDAPAPAAPRARPPPLALNGAEARPAPPLLGAAVPPARKGPPRLTLGVASTMAAPLDRASPVGGPALTVQPASPAMSSSSTPSTSPFPPPVPSTSSLDSAQHPARAPSFQPPPSAGANGGGLAARRAAKLGKKRLSLVVPANPHWSLPSAGPDGPATTLLSPVTPSFLRPSTSSMDAETRSLPPSPLLLTTFIGAEGTEAPDRTIGRLMLKQQADEMREQMRGGRGMKRRTSIPRLNLVRGGASAHPASLDPTAPPVERVATPAGGGGGAPSAVQLIRGDAVERGLAADGDVVVEEFPYANGPREIIPGVFLGSEQNAKDAQVLRDWRIGFVLNVAKEVECPWGADDEEDALAGPQVATPGQDGPLSSDRGAPSGQARSAKPQASPASTFAASTSPYGANATSQPPVRPPFVRPTASTPNLHAVFTLPPHRLLRLSTSPPQQPRRLSRQSLRRSGGSTTSAATATATAPTTSSCPGSVRYAAQARTGRPALEYLWLKWGHDEADLVEAHKFQAAFAFLDSARDKGERVLVHCQCGVSRSATVVIAYCMREAARALAEGRESDELAGCTGMHDTYSFVKEKSEWVGPNLSLVFQLVAYERTLRGDSASGEEGDEPPYPHYPPEPTSARPADDDDLPPPTPAVGFSPFAFPAPPPPVSRSTSYGMPSINGHGSTALSSPRTPSPPHPASQLSTPDLAHHDPLVSPSLSTATKASSVTSTPGSTVGRRGLSPQEVRIVRGADEGEDELAASAARASRTSGESLGAPEVGKAVPFGAFAVPTPPPSHYTAGLEDAASPTTALYPPGVPQHDASGGAAQQSGRSHFAPPLRTSSLRAALPPLQVHLPSPPSSAPRHSSPITMVVNSPSSPAPPRQLPPLQLSRPRPTIATVTSPLSPASNASVTSPTAILSALSLSSSSGSSASLAAPLSALSRTNSTSSQTGRRFGMSQTALERRASHRRVCSDTIRVPVAGLAAAVGSPGGSRPASPAQMGGGSRAARADEQQG